MKEVNKVIKREGKYKNLTDEDVDKIFKGTEDRTSGRLDDVDPEDMATGGRAGFKSGSYLFKGLKSLGKKYRGSTLEALLENPKLLGTELGYEGLLEIFRMGGMMQDGGRAGFKDGMSRRKFLQIMGGLGSIPIVGKFLKFGKAAKVIKPVKTPIVKLENTTTQMPEWFPSFVNKFRNEGKAENVFKQKKVEVSKAEYDKAIAEGKGEKYGTDVARTEEYKANNPDHMDYFKLEDTDELLYTKYTNENVPGVQVDDMKGEVEVLFENDYSQPVTINYTSPGKKGPNLGRADEILQDIATKETKQKGDFAAVDADVRTTSPDGDYDVEPVITETLDEMMEGTTRTMEEYATGKKVKNLSKGENKVIEAEIRAETAAEQAAEAAAETADDFASGGIAGMLGE